MSAKRILFQRIAFYVVLFFLATLVFDSVALGIGVATAFFALHHFYNRGSQNKQL